jgi:hypothetical protein
MNVTRAPDTLRLPSRRHPVPTRTRVRTRRVPIIAYLAVLLILPGVVQARPRSMPCQYMAGRPYRLSRYMSKRGFIVSISGMLGVGLRS